MPQHSSKLTQDDGTRANRPNPPESHVEDRCQEAESLLDSSLSEEAASARSEKDRLRIQLTEAEERETHLGRVLQAVRKLNRQIVQESDPQQLVKTAVITLTETAGYQGAWIVLFDSNGAEPVMTEARGLGKEFGALRERLLKGEFPSCVKQTLTEEKTLVICKPDTDCLDCPLSQSNGQCAILVHKIALGIRVFGVLAVHLPSKFADAEQELGLFEEVADDLAFALGRIEDIRNRREAEQLLRESEEKHRRLFETMAQGVVYQGADGSIFEANPAAMEILGLSKEVICRGTLNNPLCQAIREDGSRFSPEEYPAAVALRTGNPVRDVTMGVFCSKRDWPVWIIVSAIPLFRPHEERPYQVYSTFTDITQRREREERLLFQSRVLDQIQDRVMVTDLEANITYVNDANCRMLGRPREDMVGRHVSLLGDDIAASCTQDKIVRQTKETGQWRGEVVNFAADGSRTILDCRTHVVKDSRGESIALCGISTDVTERKATEEVLRESEAKFHALFEHMAAASCFDEIVYKDGKAINYRILDVNPAYERVAGIPRHEVVGRLATEIYGVDEVPYFDIFAKVAETGEPASFEGFFSPMGRYLSFTVSCPAKGRFSTVFFDVTERKAMETALRESERRLRTVMGNLPGMAYRGLKRLERPMEFVSEGCQSITGYSAKELLEGGGVSYGQLIFEDDHPAVSEAITNAIADGRPFEVEYRIRTANDEQRWVWERGRAVGTNGENAVLIEGFIIDITGRKQTEHALRESEQRFRSFVENAGDIVFAMNPRGIITYISPNFERLLGLSPEGWIGLSFEKMVHPEDIDPCQNFLQRTLRDEKEASSVEYRLRRADGSWRWHTSTGSRLIDEHGKVSGFVGISRDMTEQREADEALRESEQKFRAIFENAPLGMFRSTPEGRFIEVNDALAEMLGFESPEQVLCEIDNIADQIYADTEKRARIVTEQLTESARPPVLNRYRRRDGSEFVARLYLKTIRDEKGCPLYLEGIVEDLTELRRAEFERERLLSAIEQSGEVIVVTDPDGIIQYANPAFERITGYTLQEAIGRNPRFLKSGEQDDEFYQRLWATISAGCTWQGRFINRKKDGSLYTEDATVSPVWDQTGQIHNYIAVKRDISKEIDLEERYHQSQKLEAIGQLAGGIAHDFNNLLLVINGYSEMAHESVDEGSQAKRALEGVMEAGQRAATLVSQLLAFSRRQMIQPETLNLNDVVSDLMKMLTRIIGEHIRLDFVPAQALEPIYADRGMMEQIIMNLSVNSRDAMSEGGELTIETDEVELNGDFAETQPWVEPGPYVMLTVSDTGCGMDEETLGHIFEPFFTTKGVGQGTGLGLATVYGIVRQHKGAIVPSSTLGEGTTFKVYLPVTRKEPARDEPKVETVPAGGTETILLVEDDLAVLKLVRQLLERKGYTVLTANNGKVAVDLFEQHADEIDLVILDVIMPEKSGVEARIAIKKENPGVPVLFATGYADNAFDTDFIMSESQPLLRKPYEPSELYRAVREAIDS